MVNSSFAKTCEGKLNRTRVKIVCTEAEVYQWTNQPEFHLFKIFDENLAPVTLSVSEIFGINPQYLGLEFLIFQKSSFDFHYNTMKKHFDCTLFYSDTESLVYEIRSRDFLSSCKRSKACGTNLTFQTFPLNTPYTTEPMRV